MFTRLFSAAAAVLAFASLASAQAGPAGHWEGTCTIDNRPIVLTLDLGRNAKSEWIASMGVPSEHATGLVVLDVVTDGPSVRFTAVELMMASFDLTLGPDGRLKGTFSNPGMSVVPIEFRRTGEAQVQLIPPSPAVSKQLEGDWEGLLEVPYHPIRIALHFRNQADNTVAATFVNLDTGDKAVPLNDVRQAGQKVAFGLKVAHGSFEGTLSGDGTELVGQLTHEQQSMPVTLRRK